jgi:hypothetical protein
MTSQNRKPTPTCGALAGMTLWTETEDATLRASFAAGGIAAARTALPDRTKSALYGHARRLGLRRRRRWSLEDDARLRRLWDAELDLPDIAARLARTPITTYWRAQKLGLPLGCPTGWESLNVAAERTGYETSQLRRILSAHGAVIRRAVTRESKPRGRAVGTKNARRLRHIVARGEVDAAVAAWLETEPVETAARRLGWCGETLARRLKLIGVEGPGKARAHWRVRAEEVEAAARVQLAKTRRARSERGRFAAAGSAAG